MLVVWRQEANQGLAHPPPWSPPLSLKEDDTIRHQTWKIQAALGGCLSDPPPSLPAPFHLRILHKYSLGVFLPLSGPIPALPALTVVHESEGCRLSSVYGALEEADGLAYPSPSLPCPLPCSSPSPFLPLRIPHLCQEGKPTCSYFFWCLSFSLLYPDSISFPSQSIKIFEPFLYAWLSRVTQKRNKAWSLLSRSSRMEDVDTRKMSWDRS